MKVKDFYREIDLQELESRADANRRGGSDYWQKTLTFVESVWDKDVQELSKRQVEWLQKVSDIFT